MTDIDYSTAVMSLDLQFQTLLSVQRAMASLLREELVKHGANPDDHLDKIDSTAVRLTYKFQALMDDAIGLRLDVDALTESDLTAWLEELTPDVVADIRADYFNPNDQWDGIDGESEFESDFKLAKLAA